MKKTVSVILMIVICVSLLFAVPAVSADKYSDYQLGPNAEYLTHDGKTYYPIDNSNVFSFNYYKVSPGETDSNYARVRLTYSDDATKAVFWPNSYALISKGVDSPCIELDLCTDNNSFSVPYIEESYLEEYENLTKGIGASYSIDNFLDYYYDDYYFDLSAEDYNSWVSDEPVTMMSFMLTEFDCQVIYAYDKTGLVSVISGAVFVDEENEEIFLFSGNNASEFIDEYGNIKATKNKPITVYRLEDEQLRQELIEFYYSEPEDDLEWLELEKSDVTFLKFFCVFLFGVLPVLLTAFSIVMLCVIKDKKYHRSYIAMLIGSVLVLVACIAVIILFI
ncbi:MAG: hypothetical protein IJ298_02480 [Ruminococcus sp.]|nr:hypothetical protein [Ruminococcus sp.]